MQAEIITATITITTTTTVRNGSTITISRKINYLLL
jgi:hypothetical protein